LSLGEAAARSRTAGRRSFGDYELLEELAHGGMGVVYRARQVSLNRIVALKMILAGRYASSRDVRRLHAEAEAAANLDHPHIVPIYEVGEHDGQHYFAMKLVEGGNVAQAMARGQWPVDSREGQRRAARLLATVARAVHFAHQHGILHRDLKPANILLGARGEPLVADFGLAKRVKGDSGLTQSGAILGTPGYMAPEQAAGQRTLSTAADVYSLGAILYEFLTGRPPFRAGTPLDTLLLVLHAEPDRPRGLNPRADRDLETVCLKCLDKDPRKRYGSAEALAQDVERWLAGEPIRARPSTNWERAVKWARRRPAVAGLVAVSCLAAISLLAGGLWYNARLQAALRESRGPQLIAQDQEQVAEQQRGEAQTQRDAANTHRARAEERERVARKYLYAAHLNLAQQAWNDGQVARTLALLEGQRPGRHEEDLRGFEWHYLERLCRSALWTFRFPDVARFVALSPDGKTLATACDDKTCKLWDTATGRETACLQRDAAVTAVVFAPGGKVLATAGADGIVKLWDTATGRERSRFRAHETAVGCLAFSPDGKLLVSGSATWDPPRPVGELKVWDWAAGKQLALLLRQAQQVWSVAFGPDGRSLAAGLHDGTVKLWDVAAWKERATLRCGLSPVWSMAFTPDGKALATGSADPFRLDLGGLKLWDPATGEETTVFHGRKGGVWSVAFTPDGRTLAAGMGDGPIVLWDPAVGEERDMLRGHSERVHALAFAQAGKLLASAGTWDQTVRLWDLAEEQRSTTLPGGMGTVAFAPDGKTFATRGVATTAILWDARAARARGILHGHGGLVLALAFAPDSKMLASGSRDGTARLWDVRTGRARRTLRGHAGSVNWVAFHPDGKTLATGSQDSTVGLWDPDTGKARKILSGHKGQVWAVAFAPDGKTLAAADEDGIKLWDVTARKVRTVCTAPGGGGPLAFSPNGKIVAAGLWDYTVRFWDSATGRELAILRGHTHHVYPVAFSRDGRRLVSGGQDKTIRFWDVSTGQELVSLQGHPDVIQGLAFSPDGKTLISGGAEGTLKLWDASALDARQQRVRLKRATSADQVLAWHRRESMRCESVGQWFAAAVHLDALLEAEPDRWDLRAMRGYARAALGAWRNAGDDYAKAIELEGSHPLLWSRQAFVRLGAGDAAGYRKVCTDMLGRFGKVNNADLRNMVAWTCVLGPDALADQAQGVSLAEKALASQPGNYLYLNTLGAALYRAGRYHAAVKQLNASMKASGTGGSAHDWLFLAMAHQHLGHADQARQWLDKAVPAVEEASREKRAAPGMAAPSWDTRLELQLLRREAEALIKAEPAPAKP
jgi:WD40 repeat protein